MAKTEALGATKEKTQTQTLVDLKSRAFRIMRGSGELRIGGPELIEMAGLFGVGVSDDLRMILNYPESGTDLLTAESIVEMENPGQLKTAVTGVVALFEVLKQT